MVIKNSLGRPAKVNHKIINKLADSNQNNYSVIDACKYARVSRDTYYRHLKSESMFAEAMTAANQDQTKVNFNFRTTH